jgi:hypothetical protein
MARISFKPKCVTICHSAPTALVKSQGSEDEELDEDTCDDELDEELELANWFKETALTMHS